MMSLKEKMAAKKSAKEKKAVEREKKAAENVKIKQKALSPYLLANQKNNRLSLLMDHTTQSEDSSMIEHGDKVYQQLIYPDENLQDAVNAAFLMIGIAKTIAMLIQDFSPQCAKDLYDYANAAAHEIRNHEHAGDSPNQRRAHYINFKDMIDIAGVWQDALSGTTMDNIVVYSNAAHACANIYAVFNLDYRALDSTFAIMQGKRLREMAKHHRIKESELRGKILNTATHLKWIYKVPYTANSISELRTKKWQPYNNAHELHQYLLFLYNKIARPFTEMFGINLLTYDFYAKANASILNLVEKSITNNKIH